MFRATTIEQEGARGHRQSFGRALLGFAQERADALGLAELCSFAGETMTKIQAWHAVTATA